MAQGGVNACLNNVAAEDTVETHTFDTVKGSDYLGDQDAIEFFCSRCPEGVLEMDHMGAPFSVQSKTKLLNVTSVVNLIHVLATLRIKLVT